MALYIDCGYRYGRSTLDTVTIVTGLATTCAWGRTCVAWLTISLYTDIAVIYTCNTTTTIILPPSHNDYSSRVTSKCAAAARYMSSTRNITTKYIEH